MKNLTITSLMLLILPLSIWATTGSDDQRKEYTKEINRLFDISELGELSINNRHGRVDVKTWDQAAIKVDVSIVVQAKDAGSAEAIFDRIQIQFENGDDFVKATTAIEQKKSSWSKWNSWGNQSKDEYEINYEVSVPSSNRLDIRNRYGDTYIAATKGPVRADISYGSIRLQGVDNTVDLALSYGDATVIQANIMNADISYSKLSIRQSQDVDLKTKYSQINIENADAMRAITKYDDFTIHQVGHLRTEGKYGKFNIASVRQLITDGKYTDYIIGTVEEKADVILAYGGLNIETLSSDFDDIRLDGSYANFKINTTPNSSYQIEASAAYGDIQTPPQMDITYKRDSGQSYHIEGQVGKADTKSHIKVKVNYGDVRIR